MANPTSSSMQDLVELIGIPACLRLSRTYGGRTIRVPTKENENHPLSVILGAVAAASLRREFGGIHIEVPTERTALLEHRNMLIRQEVAAGAKILPTANRWGLSPKMIRKILAKAGTSPTAGRQQVAGIV